MTDTEAILARAQAAASLNALVALDDAFLQRPISGPSGTLGGSTFAVKANIEVAGMPTTAATPGLMGWRPVQDAPIVARLRAAGAALLGIANMHELALGTTSTVSAHGAARHPTHADRVPGGSSGGSAAAVAAGLVDFAVGTDTGGSCRIPAALCGCVGFRPSQGRYPSEGMVSLSPTRDTAGVLASSVAWVRAVDLVCSATDAEAPPVDVSSLRLGVPRAGFYDDLSADLQRVVEVAIARLQEAGAELVEVDLTDALDANAACAMAIVLYESVRELAVFLARRPALGLDVRELLAQVGGSRERTALESQLGPSAVSGEAYRSALLDDRPRLQRAYDAALVDHRLDALLVPTTRSVAPRLDEVETIEHNGRRADAFALLIANTDASSNAGVPSLSVPAGRTHGGLPVGMEVVGRFGADRHLLRVGEVLERTIGPSAAA